jgi:formylglycine-generating enzyme required for sulfatase activity
VVAIDKYEVSNARYVKFVKDTDDKPPFNVYGEGTLAEVQDIGNLPVVQVTWHDAVDYCFWAGKRLPTEAEWEKAARGTDGRIYPWGDEPDKGNFANFDREWEDKTTLMEVSSLPEGRSPYGIYHLAGNVREWVHDWYDQDYYSKSPDKNPQGPDNGILKVLRGGSWHSFLSDLRTASRGKGGFALKTHGVGFRCAKDITQGQLPKTKSP